MTYTRGKYIFIKNGTSPHIQRSPVSYDIELLKVAATCLFYVPRVVLGVGTPRARNSECHSRHSFTGTMHAVHIGSLGTALQRGESSVAGTKKRESKRTLSKVAATYSPTMQRSTIGDAELNDPVRNGKGWDLSAITTLINVEG